MSAGPTNPLSAKYSDISNTYTSTVFSQNWHLFAPEPVNNNVHIYIQLTDDISEEKENQWHDITQPFIKNNNNKIITPYNKTIRLIDGIFLDAVGSNYTSDLLTKYVKKEENREESPVVDNLKEYQKESQEHGVNNLYRYASSYVNSFMIEEGTNNKYIRIRLTAYETTPFSERENQNYKEEITNNHTYDWKKIDNVAPMY